MHCARCGRTFGRFEKRTYTVLPGMVTSVPTCYLDRLCWRPKAPSAVVTPVVIKPVVVALIPHKPKTIKVRDRPKEMASKFVRPWK